MFTTIVTGEVDLADVFFLVGLIIAALGIVMQFATRTFSITETCALGALAFLAGGLLVL